MGTLDIYGAGAGGISGGDGMGVCMLIPMERVLRI